VPGTNSCETHSRSSVRTPSSGSLARRQRDLYGPGLDPKLAQRDRATPHHGQKSIAIADDPPSWIGIPNQKLSSTLPKRRMTTSGQSPPCTSHVSVAFAAIVVHQYLPRSSATTPPCRLSAASVTVTSCVGDREPGAVVLGAGFSCRRPGCLPARRGGIAGYLTMAN
jgi:hypothetical protein